MAPDLPACPGVDPFATPGLEQWTGALYERGQSQVPNGERGSIHGRGSYQEEERRGEAAWSAHVRRA